MYISLHILRKKNFMKRKVYRYLGLSPWPTHSWVYRPTGKQENEQITYHSKNNPTQAQTPSDAKASNGLKALKRLSRFGRTLRAQRQLAVLYGNLRAASFKQIQAKAYKETSLHTTHLFHLLEQRLGSCLLRTNCFGSFAHVLAILREGRIRVNSIPVMSPGYRCQPGDILQFPVHALPEKQHQQSLFARSPLHLEVDYTLGYAIVLYKPQCIELPTTLLIDEAF